MSLTQPTYCDCSYCARRNAILHIVEDIDIKGSSYLRQYTFNKMKGIHFFCGNCGIFIYSVPPEPVYPYAINLCTLDDGGWRKLDLYHFDGKSL